jgi:hypothetical protein
MGWMTCRSPNSRELRARQIRNEPKASRRCTKIRNEPKARSGKRSNHQSDLELWYAARANGHKIEVAGTGESGYVSRPKEVAALIEEAALNVDARP